MSALCDILYRELDSEFDSMLEFSMLGVDHTSNRRVFMNNFT